MSAEGRGISAPAFCVPLFTRVRGIGILRTSHLVRSAKFALEVFSAFSYLMFSAIPRKTS